MHLLTTSFQTLLFCLHMTVCLIDLRVFLVPTFSKQFPAITVEKLLTKIQSLSSAGVQRLSDVKLEFTAC